MENKDKVDVLIRNDHPIMTRKLCAATGIEKPMVMAVVSNMATEIFLKMLTV
jgi:hypothetical protein